MQCASCDRPAVKRGQCLRCYQKNWRAANKDGINAYYRMRYKHDAAYREARKRSVLRYQHRMRGVQP